jgi:hypothetical protein
MIHPGSAADWLQASFLTALVACLTAAGSRALTREQHERTLAHQPAVITSRQ